jgi:hypothetical protein
MDVVHCYSPLQPASYSYLTGAAVCEVKQMLVQPHGAQIWNLFWLSTPTIDLVPQADPGKWFEVYQPSARRTTAVVRDALDDEALLRKLAMHPTRFLEWFDSIDDHSIFDCYDALNGDDWVQTVIMRAAGAAARIGGVLPLKKISYE